MKLSITATVVELKSTSARDRVWLNVSGVSGGVSGYIRCDGEAFPQAMGAFFGQPSAVRITFEAGETAPANGVRSYRVHALARDGRTMCGLAAGSGVHVAGIRTAYDCPACVEVGCDNPGEPPAFVEIDPGATITAFCRRERTVAMTATVEEAKRTLVQDERPLIAAALSEAWYRVRAAIDTPLPASDAQDERAAIVAWLRGPAWQASGRNTQETLQWVLDSVNRGDHRKVST